MDRDRPTGRPFPGRPDQPDRPPRIVIPPWTPFGPGDRVPLDSASVVAGAEALRAELIRRRDRLEKLRRRGAPPDDREPPRPFTGRRSNLLLPYLLIRTRVEDNGARPIVVPPTTDLTFHQSPDIILTTPSTTDPPVVGRGDFNTKLRGRIVGVLDQNQRYDVWVHVWNLGHAPAYGVRVRAWTGGNGQPPRSIYLGGRQLDLGDRNSTTSHLVVKLGSWGVADGSHIVATAECIADTCNGSHDWSQDRHTATRDMWAVRLPPPPVGTVTT